VMKEHFPEFHLEDKVTDCGGSIVRPEDQNELVQESRENLESV